MQKLKFVVALAVVAAAVLAGSVMWWAHTRPAHDPSAVAGAASVQYAGAASGAAPGASAAAFDWGMPKGSNPHPVFSSSGPSSPLDNIAPSHFTADASGNLVTNATTRDELERLFALNTPAQAREQLQQLTQSLPPAAARQLIDLYARYQQYTAALAQAYPPGVVPANEQAALQQLDGIHALRVEHFGADTAAAFYGADEKTARQLIAQMLAQHDPNLTLDQKAQLAQQAIRPQ